MSKYKYIIASGWWCDNDISNDRDIKYGYSDLRKVDFFYKWFSSVIENTSPDSLCIIDSHSPLKPDISKLEHNIVWIEMDRNAGHSTHHVGKYCGVSLSFFNSMMRVYSSDADYWVYVEQDALLRGKGIIEHAIDNMKHKSVTYGSGWGTPQPVQQSLIIIKKSYIPKFIFNYCNIKATDSEISPEYKFAIATNVILRHLPDFLYRKLNGKSLMSKLLSRLIFILSNSSISDARTLPFGYGRVRPINFSDKYFYFQHGSDFELRDYYSK